MTPAAANPIDGVEIRPLKVHGDSRGFFFEAFRASWIASNRPWVQWNVSRSQAGVLRGLHFHRQQSDFWLVTAGTIRVALVDIRPDSPTNRLAMCFDLDGADPRGLYIPPGVLHGYRIIEEATVMYLLDSEYTGQDEFGVRWNDRALGLPQTWYAGPEPVVSARDAALPMLADVITASPFGNRPT